MENFQIQPDTDLSLSCKEKNIALKPTHSDHTFQIEDSFNLKMCILTSAFKAFYIIMYCFLTFALHQYLALFITLSLLVSLDFWVTKNLTGKKLVGLRWWSEINEAGEEEWIFESRGEKRKAERVNIIFFWLSQGIVIVFWVIMTVVNMVKMDFFLITLSLFCFCLSMINFVCYFKCRGEHQRKAHQVATKFGLNLF